MPNVTMTLEADVLKKARRVAVEKNMTLTSLVREHLSRLASREDQRTETVIAELKKSFDKSGVVVGHKSWKREDLHAR